MTLSPRECACASYACCSAVLLASLPLTIVSFRSSLRHFFFSICLCFDACFRSRRDEFVLHAVPRFRLPLPCTELETELWRGWCGWKAQIGPGFQHGIPLPSLFSFPIFSFPVQSVLHASFLFAFLSSRGLGCVSRRSCASTDCTDKHPSSVHPSPANTSKRTDTNTHTRTQRCSLLATACDCLNAPLVTSVDCFLFVCVPLAAPAEPTVRTRRPIAEVCLNGNRGTMWASAFTSFVALLPPLSLLRRAPLSRSCLSCTAATCHCLGCCILLCPLFFS